jgi:hypothetical protein
MRQLSRQATQAVTSQALQATEPAVTEGDARESAAEAAERHRLSSSGFVDLQARLECVFLT